jgi:hypothetical protein
MVNIPGRQSLNLAERAIRSVGSAAKKMLYAAKLPPKYLGRAMECAAEHHNYIAVKTRQGRSPNEIVYDKKFDISFLKPFVSLHFVSKSDAKRTDGDRNKVTPMEAITKTEPCLFLGYMNNMSRTGKYLTLRGTGSIIHSKDAEAALTDPRDPYEVNPRMFETPWHEHKEWFQQNIDLLMESAIDNIGPGQMNEQLTDEELINKLKTYVSIEGGGNYGTDETVYDLMTRFNKTRKYLTDLANEEEKKFINEQVEVTDDTEHEGLLQEHNGEPEEISEEPSTSDVINIPGIPNEIPSNLKLGNQEYRKTEPGKVSTRSQVRNGSFFGVNAKECNVPIYCDSKNEENRYVEILNLAEASEQLKQSKDINWKEALADSILGPLARAAFHKEKESLTNTHGVLKERCPCDHDYDTAAENAIS